VNTHTQDVADDGWTQFRERELRIANFKNTSCTFDICGKKFVIISEIKVGG
jgi:hypothetical protein